MRPWTDAEIERLKRMVADCFSASEIGAALGRSRHMVIGKIHRAKGGLGRLAGTKPGNPGAGRRKAERPARPAKPARKPAAPGWGGKIAEVKPPTPLPIELPPPAYGLPATLPVGFFDAVTRGRCLHYAGDPYGPGGPDMPVCGAERAQSAPPENRYCRRHRAAQVLPC